MSAAEHDAKPDEATPHPLWSRVMAVLNGTGSVVRRGYVAVTTERTLRRTTRLAPRIARWSLAVAVLAFIPSTSQLAIADTAGWLAGIAGYVTVFVVLLWLLAAGLLWWRMGRARWGIFAPAARRARMTGIYANTLTEARENGIALVRVVRVYQVARRGTKCVVEHPWGARQDAWFWRRRPRRGQVLLVRCGVNYGPHSGRHGVMYVGSELLGAGVLRRIPAAAWRIGRKAL